jgi:hypothetical protein
MPGGGDLAARVTRVRSHEKRARPPWNGRQRMIGARRAGRHSKRAVLARGRRPPRGPGLDEGKVRLKPWSPQQVPGGGAVAEATGLGVVYEVGELEEGEDTRL